MVSRNYYAGRRLSKWGVSDVVRTITSPVMTAENPRTSEQADNTKFLALPTPVSNEVTTNMLSGTRNSADSWKSKKSVGGILSKTK